MLIRGLPIADANAHRSAATPGCAAEESLAIGDDRLDHGIGPAVVIVFPRSGRPIQVADQSLINDGFPQNFHTRQRSDSRDQGTSVIATTLHESADAPPAQLAQRRIR